MGGPGEARHQVVAGLVHLPRDLEIARIGGLPRGHAAEPGKEQQAPEEQQEEKRNDRSDPAPTDPPEWLVHEAYG